FQLSREEAEKLVKEINLSDPAPSQKRAADCVKEALAPWLTEIEKSLRSAGAAPSFFYLCGGAGGMEGLQEAVAQTLQSAPAVLEGGLFDKTFPVAGPEGIDRERFSRLFVEAAGLALAPDGASDGERINFRREEFVFGKETLEKRNRLVSLGLIVLLLLGLMGADLYLHYHGKETHFQNLKRQLRSSFTETFPQTKNVVNEIEQIRTMIGELDRRGAFLGAGGISPLEVLREVTTAVPPEVRIDVQELVVDGEKIRIEAQTDSYESVDRIRGGLLKSSRFQEVNVGDAKVSADQSKVSFRIQMSVAERGKR
ncbi:MAG TPA: hypothetical protein VI382_04430, partial [Candidatus Manganitrophaceae bacterium]|nr:hypothetical protein [Candidatus Manganitrophaceae bacterium]